MPASGLSATGTSTAAAAQTVTVSAPSYGTIYVKSFNFTVTATAPGADITATLKDGSTAKHVLAIAATEDRGAFREVTFELPIRITERADATLVISAGGTGAITIANIVYSLDV